MKYAGLFALALAAVAVGMPDTPPYAPAATPYKPDTPAYKPETPAYKPETPAYTPPAYTPPAYTPPAYTPPPCDPVTKICKLPAQPDYEGHKHSKLDVKINAAAAAGAHIDHAAEKVFKGLHKLKELGHNVLVDFKNKFKQVGHDIAVKIAKHKCAKKEYEEICTNNCKEECPKKCDQHCHSDHIEFAVHKCTETCKKHVKKTCIIYEEEQKSSSSSSSSSSSTDCKGPSCPSKK